MNPEVVGVVKDACKTIDNDPTRLMDAARFVQERLHCVSPDAIAALAQELDIPAGRVRGLVSFYSFLSEQPKGEIVIRVCDDVPDRMSGYERVMQVFADELGIQVGETTPDGKFTLEHTACIGMSDQAPAAMINDVIVTELNTDRVKEIVSDLRKGVAPERLARHLGDGHNAHDLVRSMVKNNIRKAGPIVITETSRGEAIRKATAMSPAEVIRAVKTSRLRGRGGAGFPVGMKWEYTRGAEAEQKYVVCNADEGEPGTFKDRVLLTELPDRVFAGMTIAGYAIGATKGIMYLRAEYAYLRTYLESVLDSRREEKLLGKDILGHEGFEFDIRIQMGAGAYVCGEETALINSCEGMRGDPRNRPPFPAQSGYLGMPTSVNNVETLACVTRILEVGPATFCEYGNEQSAGTKLLSISGDCRMPGVFEVPFGTTIREVLDMASGRDALAVQVGGPSGQLINKDDFDRQICFDDLSTGGSIVIFGPERNPIEIAHLYLEFFEDESCGYCTPCRAGTKLLRIGLERILAGKGEPSDLEHFRTLGKTMKETSRCGLGQTAANPVLTSMASFPDLYESLVADDPKGFRRSFDLETSTAEARRIREGGNNV